MKRPYELAVVFRILANDEETQNAIEQVRGWIEQADSSGQPQGAVTRIDRTTLGRRKLAYEIDKQRDGLYVIFRADIEPTHITELELNLKLAQTVLRHLIVRLDEDDLESTAPSTNVAVAVEPVVDEQVPAAQEEANPAE